MHNSPVEKPDDSRRHFEWIDILRGLAALGVVLFHSRVDLWVGWKLIRAHPEQFSSIDRLTAWLSLPLPFLGSGVMLFFLLSGFCIHYPSAGKSSVELRSYAVRRFLRIAPPYLAAVCLSLLIESICAAWGNLSASGGLQIWKTALFVQNYPPTPVQLNSNPSLWSLPVEMELYAVYPLLLMLAWRIGPRLTLSGVVIVSAIATLLLDSGMTWLVGNFAKYWVIWCAGAVLAHWARKQELPPWKKWYFLILTLSLAVAAVLQMRADRFGLAHYFWAVGYFFILWKCLLSRPPGTLLPKPLLNGLLWLGKVSYSLYLIHFPLFYLLGLAWTKWQGSKPTNLLVCFLASAAILPLAGLFHNCVEKPSHELARRLGKKA